MRNYRRLSAGLLCTVFITRVRRIAQREGAERVQDEKKRRRRIKIKQKGEKRAGAPQRGVRSRLAVAKERTSDRDGADAVEGVEDGGEDAEVLNRVIC